MKNLSKIITFILSVAILLTLNHSVAEAATDTVGKSLTNSTQTTITYDDDGGYFVETMEPTPYLRNTSMPSVNINNTTETKSKTKTISYYNSKNTLCWKYSLTATFNIKMGVSATYKSSKASCDKYDSWSLVNESHSGSGSKASGTITMKKDGITKSKTITIYCDRYGTFS